MATETVKLRLTAQRKTATGSPDRRRSVYFKNKGVDKCFISPHNTDQLRAFKVDYQKGAF